MYTSFLMYMVVFLKHEHQSGPQISAPTTWCSDHPQPNLDRRGKRTNVPCKSMGWISDVTFPMDIRELVLGGVRFPVFLHIQGYHFLPLALAFWLSWLISNVAARVMSCCDQFFFSLVYAEDQIRYCLYQSVWQNVSKSFELYF